MSYLFGFALGVVSGANATRRIFNRDRPDFEGVDFAGSSLDTLAGDALLRIGQCNWFLLELKAGYADVRADLKKPRVQRLQEAVTKGLPRSLDVAHTAHQLLYLGLSGDLKAPELATLSYLGWLGLQGGVSPTDIKRNSVPFTSFLFDAGSSSRGFTLEQIAAYIRLMGDDESGGGRGGLAAAAETRLGLAINAAGLATLVTYEKLMEHIIAKDPASARTDFYAKVHAAAVELNRRTTTAKSDDKKKKRSHSGT